MLLAAMLAMVLAAAAPVLAQDVNVTTGDNVEYNAVCQNIIGAIGDVSQGTAVAAAGNASDIDDSAVIAEVAQEQNVSIAQVNFCLNNFTTVTATATGTATPTATVAAKVQYGKKFVVIKGKTVTATATPTATVKTVTATATPTATASATATAAAVLPETGGASLFALGAGALLVGGGLLARRIAR